MPLRPDVGIQAQFRVEKRPRKYSYDSSLSPALEWDGQNWARELGEWLIRQIEEASQLEPPQVFEAPRVFGDVEVSGLADAVGQLKALSRPFLDWAGRAERLSFDVPTLPLFVHERLSTKAILETLTAHERDRQMELQLFSDPQLPLHQQLEAYEHRGDWVNRMILGDSLVVMNSLLEYEGLGGQVQMIYIDPPYGVKFGSNFQPFVRKRDVRNNDDADMTREPEMVKAYRDTWELGLHSYLTYLRDRLLVAYDLLARSGSVFVQIGDANIHVVRSLIDEVFGEENFVSLITVKKTSGATTDVLPGTTDYLIWYARDRPALKFHQLYRPRVVGGQGGGAYTMVQEPSGKRRRMTSDEAKNPAALPAGYRTFRLQTLTSQSQGRAKGEGAASWFPVELAGKSYRPPMTARWKTNEAGMERLIAAGRVEVAGNSINYVRFHDDFPVFPLTNLWDDTQSGSAMDKIYAVQTSTKIVERCMLMTTDPGDLVLDPTCGSGTTAYVAEQWGRRWITIDTSRVPLALARQRLLTATFPFYALQDPDAGPVAGFLYERRRNKKGEEVGGIVPHVTLKSIASDEPAAEEVLVDRPQVSPRITRVAGAFAVEATIPTPADGVAAGEVADGPDYIDRMLETLRRNPLLQLAGAGRLELTNVRQPASALSLSGEAVIASGAQPVAIVFGPENGAVSEKLVYEAAREANLRSYTRLIVIGFAIEPNARALVDKIEAVAGIPAVYVQATPDLVMGDLLKTMRSSQLFSVTGLPDVVIRKVAAQNGDPQQYQVELRGLDTFDPSTFETVHKSGDDVPAWFLDTAWNGQKCFCVSQAFFPRTAAWNHLKRALYGEFDDSVWQHLAGVTSAPFVRNGSDEVAVKVIDDRGNELLLVKNLADAR